MSGSGWLAMALAQVGGATFGSVAATINARGDNMPGSGVASQRTNIHTTCDPKNNNSVGGSTTLISAVLA